MKRIVERLARLRRRARIVFVAERSAVLLAAVLGAATLWITLDAIVRFPAPLRFTALMAGVAALAASIARWWWPAVRFAPPLAALALRVERQRPRLAGRLASSVEFATHGPRGRLEERVIDETERMAGDDPFTGLIRRDRLLRALGGAAAALVVPLVLIAADRESVSIGLRRLLTPWAGVEWPARTLVASLMDDVTHLPKGRAVMLRAEAVRGDPSSMRPFARYRVERGGTAGPWREVTLARQHGRIFERPLEVEGDAIEFRFGTEDAMTDVRRIELVAPPAVARAVLRVEPPDYAQRVVAPRVEDLGPGTDGRASPAAPVLAGSEIEFEAVFSRPLPIPIAPEDRAAWARASFGTELPDGVQVEASSARSDRVQIRFRAERDLQMPVELVDEHGIASEDGAKYRIVVVQDRAPMATITEPAADEVVLPSAALRIVAEARDDLSIDEVGVRVERKDQPPQERRRRERRETARMEMTLTPSDFGAGPGETLLVSAIATDDHEIDGVRRPPSVSSPRRIRVVGEEEFTRQIRAQLGSVRQAAIRAEAIQRDIMASAQRDDAEHDRDRAADAASDLVRRQSQLSDRIRSMREAVASLDARARAGGLEQESLAEIMRQAQDLLEAAERSSAEASSALAERAGADPGRQASSGEQARPGQQAQAAAERAAEAQESVRAELEDLVRLLDRDEDAWVATRRLERLSQEIESLIHETRRTGERTVGRELERLSAEERMALDRLAQRDRAVAEQARETIDELRDRAERLAASDRTRAAGMREAARRGEERQVARRMEQAAAATAQNQPTNAEQSLREAAESVQAMMDAVRDDRRSRVEELRRRLASLEESLRRLVTQAGEALAEVRAVEAGGRIPDATIARVIALDRNIGGVTDEARSGGGTERVARLLERAGERTSVSAARLRADPPRLREGDEALDRARALLVEALEVAREQRRSAEQQQAEARRRELAAALRELSERQAGLRSASEPLRGADSGDRRKLVEGRRLSVEQELIRKAVSDLRLAHEELSSSDLFQSALDRLDAWLVRSAESLSRLRVTPRTLDEQTLAAETLAMMGQALADPSSADDPFAEAAMAAQDAGAGGGPQGEQRPAIPPVAELRLLRETQAQISRRTRAIDEGMVDPSEREMEIRELSRLQQQLLEQGEAWVERVRQQSQGQPEVRRAQ